MNKTEQFITQVRNNAKQFIPALFTHIEAWNFIALHKPWQGILKRGWFIYVVLGAGIIVALNFFSIFIAGLGKIEATGISAFGASMVNAFDYIAKEEYNYFFQGGIKYIVLILMEVLIFYCSGRTLEIITGQDVSFTVNDFINAQKRAIKVSIFSFVMEILVSVGFSILLSLMNADFLESPMEWFVQSFFIGFAMIDNYNEHHGMGVKESFRTSRQFIGVGLAVGIVGYLFFLVPFIGAIIGSILGAVTATLIMHDQTHLSTIALDFVHEQPGNLNVEQD